MNVGASWKHQVLVKVKVCQSQLSAVASQHAELVFGHLPKVCLRSALWLTVVYSVLARLQRTGKDNLMIKAVFKSTMVQQLLFVAASYIVNS